MNILSWFKRKPPEEPKDPAIKQALERTVNVRVRLEALEQKVRLLR